MNIELLKAVKNYYKYNYVYSYGTTAAERSHAYDLRAHAINTIQELTGQSLFAVLRTIKGNK